jgi:hypothetical protein
MLLTLGCTETGRNEGISTSVFTPAESGVMGSTGVVASADIERKYCGLPWFKVFAIISGGSRLILFPCFALSSNCLASSRLCAANASSGDSSGGTSPAMCNLGEGSDRRDGEGRVPPKGPWDCDRRSINIGRFVIVSCQTKIDIQYYASLSLSLSFVAMLPRASEGYNRFVADFSAGWSRRKYCGSGMLGRCGCRLNERLGFNV